jgi:hypothetical protein
MNKFYISSIIFALILILFPVFGVIAAESGAEIVYFDNPGGDIAIENSEGEVIEVDFGVILATGTKIDTGRGTLELRLVPNGTILKLSSDTSFELRALQSEAGSKENIFSF